MQKGLSFIVLAIFLLAAHPANAGFIYNNTTTPLLVTDMQTDNIKNLKVGEAQIFHCLGIIDTGNAGIQKAAIRGGITRIHHVEVQTKTILSIGMSTVRVYGE